MTAATTHTLTVPRWHPAKLNQLLGGHWPIRHRLKRNDRDLVAFYARTRAVPRATGKRRVSLRLTLRPRQRAGDPDCYWKSTLDALVRAGLLVDDNRHWVELGPVEFDRGLEHGTSIILEDLP